MKKPLSVILCAIMLIAMASTAFANEPINDNVNVGLEAYAGDDGYYGRPRGIPEWELRALLVYEYYGSDGSGGLTYSQVRTKLQNGYPVLADIYSSSNVGHAVIICGCINATDGSVKYRLRDPNSPAYVYVSNVSLTSTNFTYVSGSTTYTRWSSYVW